VTELEGFRLNSLWNLRTLPEILVKDALKLKFLKGSATPLFHSLATSLPGYTGVRLAVLILAKFNLLW